MPMVLTLYSRRPFLPASKVKQPYRWNLRSGEDILIDGGEAYTNKVDCAAEAIAVCSGDPGITWEVYRKRLALPSQRWRFRARAGNNRKVAKSSEGYLHRDGAQRIVNRIKAGAYANAAVVDVM